MKLEKIGIIADIVGTAAIIVTLALVLYELRQNTAASYAASWDAITESQIEWRLALVSNSELRDAWSERQGQDIDVADVFGTALLLNYERAYLAKSYGRLGEAEWARYQRSVCGRTARELMSGRAARFFTDEFVALVQACPD